MDQKTIKNLLSGIHAAEGGSLICASAPEQVVGQEAVLFIGLGGLGCRTVNEIKGACEREPAQMPQVRFLAVDSDDFLLSRLLADSADAEPDAHLSAEESFLLYSSDAMDLLIHRPSAVKQWMSDDVPTGPISSDGTRASRVVGRALLCGTGKYHALREAVSRQIQALCAQMPLHDRRVSVVIVSGLSGGTGGGIFADVSYMVRLLLAEKHERNQCDGDLFGVFFMPDVQACVPALAGDMSKWSQLSRNGYAALKELDYFVNVGDLRRDSEKVYTLCLPDGTCLECSAPMFDAGRVFLISATDELRDCGEILRQTARNLIGLFRKRAGEKAAPFLSFSRSVPLVRENWMHRNAGAADPGNAPDPCGVRGCAFPSFLNYNFSSFGSSTIRFPREEIAAYCAGEAFRRIDARWQSAARLTAEDVRAVAEQCGVGDLDQIAAHGKQALGIADEDFRIRFRDTAYPARRWSASVRAENLNAAVEDAENRAKARLDELDSSIDPVQDLYRQILSCVENEAFLTEHGPRGALTLLRGDDSEHEGICGVLQERFLALERILQDKESRFEEARDAMHQARDALEAKRSPRDEELEHFLTVCTAASERCFEFEFYRKYMSGMVPYLHQKLENYCSEVLAPCLSVLDTVGSMLAEDAALLTETAQPSVDGQGSDFSGNLRAAFLRFSESFVEPNMVDAVTELLVKSLLNGGWQDAAARPEAFCEELREVFSPVTGPLRDLMPEKYLAAAFISQGEAAHVVGHSGALTRDDICRLWSDQMLRGAALQSAARIIVRTLLSSAQIRFSVDPDTGLRFQRLMYVTLPGDTPELNSAIRTALQKTGCSAAVRVRDDAPRSEIRAELFVTPFPITMVHGMRGYAEEYFQAERSVILSAGRHLDEVTELWQRYLPELYGEDAEDYFFTRFGVPRLRDAQRRHAKGAPQSNDRAMYEQIRSAVEYGMKNDYIRLVYTNRGASGSYHIILPAAFEPELLLRVRKKMLGSVAGGKGLSFADAMYAIEEEEHEKLYTEISLDTGVHSEILKSRQTAAPDDPDALTNLHRLIRARMDTEKCVLNAKEQFENIGGGDFFETVSSLRTYESVILKFCRAYMLGLITYKQRKGWICAYSRNKRDPVIPFFRDAKQSEQNELDTRFHWYLVISAFSRIADNKYLSEIDDLYDAAKRDQLQLCSCQEIIGSLQEGFESDVMSMANEEARAMALAELLQSSVFHSSGDRDKDYYSFPLPACDPDAVIENLRRVLDVLLALQEHKQIV